MDNFKKEPKKCRLASGCQRVYFERATGALPGARDLVRRGADHPDLGQAVILDSK